MPRCSLNGRWHLAVDMSTGRMHESVDYGVYQLADTWDERDHWRQDHSGGVHALNSSFARRDATTAKWLARYGFLQVDADGARIEYLGELRAEGRTYERLRATPQGGQTIELWFDEQTGLLARSVWIMPIEVTRISYADYRRVASLMMRISAGGHERIQAGGRCIHGGNRSAHRARGRSRHRGGGPDRCGRRSFG